MQLRLHKSRVLRPHHIREGNRSVGHQYGSIAAPLTQLFELGVFKRNDEAQKAFEKLQDTTMTLPVLALLDFNILFEVETNASGYGIGAVLMQNHRPIAFYSHTLALRDRAKPVFERKLMAVSKESSNRSIKRIAKLLGYSFEVVYKLGSENKELRLKEIIQKLQGGEEVNNLLDATWHASVQGEDSNCQTSSLIPAILHTYHDSVFRGHSGFLRTYKRSTGQLYWEGMKSDIQKYCEECVVCQRNKSLALTPAGLLLPLEIPNKVWNDISMDFIEGLPKAAGSVYDNHEWIAVPDEVFGYRKDNKQNWEILISWKGLPRHEATWEKYDDFQQSFPDFHLEDEVNLEQECNVRPPIIHQYARRNKNKAERSANQQINRK
ncbi:transposon Tf2-1 polyprotein isoform X1 [Cucumis melo var. makuwa]|uniref:Transposon Tf2-1 polyprotein isoform X1 n=1 Tax=Cucumis melo var. makuwa TaxID=1194695 RepID=A0A5A7U4P9_CUCMM|nr:transposon Tf2-1 polyprotein isoform X1 [Cucumis melo var. makuwa]